MKAKKENLRAWSREDFNEAKSTFEVAGYKVVSRWRKGIKSIRLAPIVLREWNGEQNELCQTE